MIGRIARKEFLEVVRDGRFQLIGGMVWLLLIAGGVGGLFHYIDSARVQAEAQAAERVRWLEQDPKHPHSAAHFGVYVFRPISPLAALDPGVDSYTGVAVWLEAHRQNEMLYRPVRDATPLERFGRLHVGSVVALLLPLVIFLLAFGAFSGERERGTLRQVLSLGISPAKLLLGKFLGIGLVVALFLLPAAFIALVAAGWTAPAELRQEAALRALFWIMAAVVYLASCLFVALAISAWAPSSRAALSWLLLFWVFNGLVAPRAIGDLASHLAPLPSSQKFYTDLSSDLANTRDLDAKVSARLHELFEEHNVDAIGDLPFNFSGLRLQMDEEFFNSLFDYHYGGLYRTIDNQNTLFRIGGIVAPFLAMQSVSMGLAGTDFRAHEHFSAAAEKFRRAIQVVLNEAILDRPVRPGEQLISGVELWDQIPEFRYAPMSFREVASGQAPAMGLLSAWLVVAVMLARGAVTRMKVQ